MLNIGKIRLLLATLFLGFLASSHGSAQATSSVAYNVKVYSGNGRFYLNTTPFDDEFPTLRGITIVCDASTAKVIYRVNRGFDSVKVDRNNLVLSDDGRVIFFLITVGCG